MSRFESLKSNSEKKNPFKTKKNSNYSERTISQSQSQGAYRAPGYKEKKNDSNLTFVSERKINQEKTKTLAINEQNFPSLGKSSSSTSNEEKTINTKNNWANITKTKETENKNKKKEEPLPDGWIRIRYDKKTKKITKEYGKQYWDYQDTIYQFEQNQDRYELESYRNGEEEYINNWEYDDYLHHQNWLQKLHQEDEEQELKNECFSYLEDY